MKKLQIIAVVGGGGRTGKYLLDQLLEQGFRVKLLLRNPALFENKHPGIEIVRGDAIDPKAIHTLISGCDAVISLIGQRKNEPLVSAAATRHIIEAMEIHGVERYIVATGLSIDTPADDKGFRTRISSKLMKWIFPTVVEDKQNAYKALAESGVKWTLVRLPYIVFTDARSKIEVSLTDCTGSKVSSANIASFVIAQLSDTRFEHKAPFIANS